MSDIDFDELDRAVNSLIANTPAKDGAAEPTVPSIPAMQQSTEDENQIPVTSTPSPVATQSLAGQRSSGRFMDVIHPSADMRATTAMPNATKPNPVPAASALPPKPNTSMPTFSASDFNEPKPLESPFITGAKVEKRPLGAFSDEETLPPVELSPSGEVTETYNQMPDSSDIEEFSPVLPEELQSDLLKIESGNVGPAETAKEPEAPAFEKDPTTPTSIVQQYKEKASSTEVRPGSIYDTNVYHKSPSTDGKKKSGWLWVLWIVLLLAVGVGAGAITYFYVLPLL